jgi:hypothetical protein
MRRALFAAALLLLTGCDSSPSEPNRTQSLAGTLARAASTVSLVTMNDTGNLRVRVLDLDQVAADGTVGAAGGGLNLGIGTGDATSCTATGNFVLLQDSLLSLGLARGNYCLKLTEPTVVPEGASVRYEIQLEITD